MVKSHRCSSQKTNCMHAYLVTFFYHEAMMEHKLSTNVKKMLCCKKIRAVKALLVDRWPENTACNVTEQ